MLWARAAALALVCSSTASSAWALAPPSLSGRVTDLAGQLDAEAKQGLTERLAQYERQSGHQFAVLIVPSLQGDAIENFSLRVVEKWKLGGAKPDDGLLLLVALAERKIRIEVGYGLEGNIPDAVAARVIRETIQPAFRDQDFAGGLSRGLTALMQAASGVKGAIPTEPPSRYGHTGWLTWLFIVLFFVLPLMRSLGGRRRTGSGMVTGLLLGSLLGSSGRGGWGGGGGGFSGGGGHFGGGGATGGW